MSEGLRNVGVQISIGAFAAMCLAELGTLYGFNPLHFQNATPALNTIVPWYIVQRAVPGGVGAFITYMLSRYNESRKGSGE